MGTLWTLYQACNIYRLSMVSFKWDLTLKAMSRGSNPRNLNCALLKLYVQYPPSLIYGLLQIKGLCLDRQEGVSHPLCMSRVNKRPCSSIRASGRVTLMCGSSPGQELSRPRSPTYALVCLLPHALCQMSHPAVYLQITLCFFNPDIFLL